MLEEKKIQLSIIKYFKKYEELGYPVYIERRQAGGFAYKEGAADLYVVIDGIHIEIETKATNGKQRSMQKKWQQRCEQQWHILYILAYDLNCIKKIMETKFPFIFKKEN